MDGKEVTITIAEFYAFGIKNQKPYVDKSDEFILSDLEHICNTGRLISIIKYTATHQETKLFTVSELIIEEVSSVVEEYTIKEAIEESKKAAEGEVPPKVE